jgi:hypothetical protein
MPFLHYENARIEYISNVHLIDYVLWNIVESGSRALSDKDDKNLTGILKSKLIVVPSPERAVVSIRPSTTNIWIRIID